MGGLPSDNTGFELWKSDGTAAGTVLAADINPGPDGSSISEIVAVNTTLFFNADNEIGGRELWKAGATSSPEMVKNIFPGQKHSTPTHLTNVSGTLFFSADDGANGRELWKSDWHLRRHGSGEKNLQRHKLPALASDECERHAVL